MDILSAYDWLSSVLNLPTPLCTPPKLALRTYQYYLKKSPPETLLLNSFFLEDLSKARDHFRAGSASENIRRYLGDIKPQVRKELLRDETALSDALHPSKIPMGSWPANGRFHLLLCNKWP